MMVATLATFPEHPADLARELVEFAVRLTGNCICDSDGRALRKLIENEGGRYPELFATWKDYGPGKNWPAISARFARLARDGELEFDDPDLAARQFMALIGADLPNEPGDRPSDEQLHQAARNGVKTFLRAYGKRDIAAAL